MFWSKNKKNRYTPTNPILQYKSGVQGGIHFTEMFSLCTANIMFLSVVGREYGPPLIGFKDIDGLLVPPSKASTLLTDNLITG